jgi:hypothetical protein
VISFSRESLERMSAAFVLSWPGSRVLLGWWRELARRKPQQVRLGRLLVHRVEALVRVQKFHPLDRWQRALLDLAGTRVPNSGDFLSSLTDLQMDPQILCQLVRELTASGLLHRNGTGLWQMTPAGRQALQTGTVSVAAEERRTFSFLDNSERGRPPHFLPLSGERQPAEMGRSRGGDAPRSEAPTFEIASLEACLRQTLEWKRRFRFPPDVESLVLTQIHELPAANWRRVLLDAVEKWLFVFIHLGQSSPTPLLGFAVHPEGWALETEPRLALADGWQEVLPDLAAEPSPQMWRHAWQSWSQPRSLPPAEVEACRLERVDYRLLVHAPLRLIDRLRTARSDAVKQEAWLLAGDGRTRTAAQIELHPL